MARTQAADYDTKRDAITHHATRLFARRGFAGASIADLAECCKVSKSLIYHYYASKEEILYDVMIDHIGELLDAVTSVDTNATAPDRTFRALTKTLLQHYAGAADRQKVLLYELDSLPRGRKLEIVSKQRQIISHVEDLLAAANPALKKDRAVRRARTMLYFGMLNWTHTWYQPKGAVTRDELAELAAEMVLGTA